MNIHAKINGLPYAYTPKIVNCDVNEVRMRLQSSALLHKQILYNDLLYEKLHKQRKIVIQMLQQRIDKLEAAEKRGLMPNNISLDIEQFAEVIKRDVK
jgi:hypothetical protein